MHHKGPKNVTEMEIMVNRLNLEPYVNDALRNTNNFESQSKRQQINHIELKNKTPHPKRFTSENLTSKHTRGTHLMNFEIGKVAGREDPGPLRGAGYKAQSPAFYDGNPTRPRADIGVPKMTNYSKR